MKRFRTIKPLENLVVNHVGSSSPANPWVGMLWFDTSSDTLKVCTQVTPSVVWKNAGSPTGSSTVQFRVISSDATLDSNDHVVLVNASGGNRTITLPNASTILGKHYVVKKIDSSTRTVTIVPHTGQTIDGMSSYVLEEQYQFVSVVSVQVGNAFRWVIIGR